MEGETLASRYKLLCIMGGKGLFPLRFLKSIGVLVNEKVGNFADV